MQLYGRTYQAGESVYSDWFPRGGDNAIVRAQLVDKASSGSPDMDIEFFTKDTNTAGDPSTPISGAKIEFNSESAGAVKNVVMTGDFEELIRIRIKQAGAWMNVEVFPFVFFDSSHP